MKVKTGKVTYKDIKELIESNQITEASELCLNTLLENPFDEKILELHLRCLLLQNKSSEAYQEYRRMETMYLEVMGLKFSEKLRKLYNQIQRATGDEELPLEDMLEIWLKGADFPGAFYCDVDVFKIIYQVEARGARRASKSTYIVRIDATGEIEEKRPDTMKQLGFAIAGSIRKGDLFTRSSPNQYMLMLHNINYENSKKLVNRIIRAAGTKRLADIVKTSIQALIPIEE